MKDRAASLLKRTLFAYVRSLSDGRSLSLALTGARNTAATTKEGVRREERSNDSANQRGLLQAQSEGKATKE